MINIVKNGYSLVVTSDNGFPFDDGKLSLPLNSISMSLEDDSDVVIFKSVANGDILFQDAIDAIKINNESVTKDNIVSKFATIATASSGGGGGGGTTYTAGSNISITNNVISVTGISVPTKVSELTNDSGFVNETEAYEQGMNAAGDYAVENDLVYSSQLDSYYTKTQIDNKDFVDGTTAYEKGMAAAEDYATQNGLIDSSALNSYYTKTDIDTAGFAYTIMFNDYYTITEIDNKGYVTSSELPVVPQFRTINGQAITGDTSNITIGGGSSNIIDLTQAEYDALATKEPNTIYNITDATPINIANYYTKSEIDAKLGDVNTILENIIGG